MGLYGNIMTAPDGSIFTFDKVYASYPSTGMTEVQKRVWLNQQANIDGVFVGRFIFIQETCEVYMKTVKRLAANQPWEYEYVLIASLLAIKQLSDAQLDEWISITTDDKGAISIQHLGPTLLEVNYEKITLTQSTYKPNTYYYFDNNNYILDSSENFSEERIYYKKVYTKEDLPNIYIPYAPKQGEKVGDNIFVFVDNSYVPAEKGQDFNSEIQYYSINQHTYIPKITYDQKGHIMKEITPVTEQDDYTLVLDGGAFLNN